VRHLIDYAVRNYVTYTSHSVLLGQRNLRDYNVLGLLTRMEKTMNE